jgi:hypothetical protein
MIGQQQQYGRGFVQYPAQQPVPIPQSPQQLVPPYVAQFGPQLVPVQYQQPGMQMSAYLTVPEPVDPEESWLWRLLREVVRSMFKATGHTAANFFDNNTLRLHDAPTEPINQAPPVIQK